MITTCYFYKDNEFICARTYPCPLDESYHLLRNQMKSMDADFLEMITYTKEEDSLMEEISHTYLLR